MLKIFIPGREGSIIIPSCLRAFQSLGHHVRHYELKNDRQTGLLKLIGPLDLLNEVIQFGPDMIFDVNGAGCDGEGIILSSYKILGIPVFVWFVDNPFLFLNNGKNEYLNLFTKLVFDMFLINKMEGLGISDVHHLPLGTDIDYFRPLKIDNGYDKYKADISFVGGLYEDRCRIYRRMLNDRWPDMPDVMNDVIDYSVKILVNGKKLMTNDILREAFKQFGLEPEYPDNDIEWILNIITEYESGRDIRIQTLRNLNKYNLKVYGDNLSSYLPDGVGIYPYVPYFEELPKVYNASAINLNISRTQLRSAVNQRVFDVAACRSFLLTDYSQELEDYFVIGKEVGCYRDKEELDKLIRFYLDNPLVRAKIAEAGYERAVNEHNYAGRMKRVIDIYERQEKTVSPSLDDNSEAWKKAYTLLGQLYLRRGDKTKAKECFRKALNKGSGNYISHFTAEQRISLCMIVKNEEERLAACLESVRGIVDEIVVADTGSTDTTCKIAASYGAKIVHHEWINDFSAARNVSLQNATGEYILWLDADEYLPSESREILTDMKRKLPAGKDQAFSFILRSKREDSYDESFRRMRLFPNKAGIMFRGKVHEDVAESLKSLGVKSCNTDIVVLHDGYRDNRNVRAKVERNLPILLAQEAEFPEDIVTSFYLANSYYCIGRTDDAIRHMVKVTQCREPAAINSTWFPFAFIKLAQFYRESARYDEVFKTYDELFNLYPDFTAGHFFKGEFLYFQKQYESALREFNLVNTDCMDIYEYPVPADKIRYLVCYYSGVCLMEIEKYARAAEYFVRAMEIAPDELNLHLSLSRLFAITGDIESCVEACNKIMKDLGISKRFVIDSLDDLAGVYREIGSHLEGLSRHQESLEAYKSAVSILRSNREPALNKEMT